MENSSLSGGEESLNVSETVGEERFCSGDEHVANCVSYIDQVRRELYYSMLLCVCVCVCAGVACVGSAVCSEERLLHRAEPARPPKHCS